MDKKKFKKVTLYAVLFAIMFWVAGLFVAVTFSLIFYLIKRHLDKTKQKNA